MERISLGRIYQQAQSNISRNFGQVFAAQTQLATGYRINRPSDDIAGTQRIMSLGDEKASIARYLNNVGSAQSHVRTGSSQLLDVSGTTARIRELTVQGANGTLAPADRQSVAAEIDALIQNIVGSLNIKMEDRYLFAGTETGTPPFQLETGRDGLTRMRYLGNDEVQQVEVGPNVRMGLNVPGQSLLSSGPRGATTFAGSTGAAPGTGSDSAIGRDRLQITHTQTLYGGTAPVDPASGLAPGTSSVSGDTILGSNHSISLSTDAAGNGVISLNGGPDVMFTAADSDLRVEGPDGEVIYVDTTAMVPNLPGGTAVAVQSNGTMSTDGGTTTTPINFASTAQQVIDSETGGALNVDTTGIRFAGSEDVTYEGTADLITTILTIRDLLMDETRNQDDIAQDLGQRLGDLDRGLESITNGITSLGARESRLDAMEGRLGDLGVTLDALTGEIRDADIAQVISDMQRFETLYQASLSLAARAGRLSLLNYL
jgi:flagellar hook-associated protein 3 FlgL